ncbi:MAG: tetratricopeptide repeat protein, partial [Candidatus Limnocylindria bacterium]
VLVRTAEALCRLRRGREALGPAGEAAALFSQLRRERDAAEARYWLAFAHHLADNSAEARTILRGLLGAVRDGMAVQPDFQFRVLVALANVEGWEGRHPEALAYLEEARGLTNDLDDWRRAALLHNLSRTYAGAGDDEAAYRTGSQALALFQAIAARREVASMENTLALTLVRLGNVPRAREMADAARLHADTLPDTSFLSFVRETEAQIALAAGDLPAAHTHLDAGAQAAEATGNREAAAAIHRTRARVLAAEGRKSEALAELERAADGFRELQMPGRLRPVLSEWADLLSAEGRTEEALARYREALALAQGA